jgi:hypothetical protein
MTKSTNIPVFGVPAEVIPDFLHPIYLYWHRLEGLNWEKGKPARREELEQSIERSRGGRLPSDFLPALDPGDVVILEDGIFWIDRDWKLQAVN